MKMMTVAAALALGLAGCGTMDGMVTHPADHPPGADGAWCGTPGASGPVYIEVHYAGDGTPSAVPDTCRVAAGTDITWRGPPGDLVAFKIVFPAASPAWRDDRRLLVSSEVDRQYKVKIKAADQAGTYKYGIQARGKEIDPAIIIR